MLIPEVRLLVPSLPTTSKLKVPVACDPEIVKVAVLLAVGLTALGEKPQEIPAGLPEQERLTVPVKPLRAVTVQVETAFCPCWFVKLDGEQETEKSGVGGTPAGWTVSQADAGPKQAFELLFGITT